MIVIVKCHSILLYLLVPMPFLLCLPVLYNIIFYRLLHLFKPFDVLFCPKLFFLLITPLHLTAAYECLSFFFILSVIWETRCSNFFLSMLYLQAVIIISFLPNQLLSTILFLNAGPTKIWHFFSNIRLKPSLEQVYIVFQSAVSLHTRF